MKELNQLNLKDKKYIIFDMDGTLIEEYGKIHIDLNDIQLKR